MSNDNDRALLEQEIASKEFAPLLKRLQFQNLSLRGFASWLDVVKYMRDKKIPLSAKDNVLRPILAAHAEDMDSRWRTILLVFFWPGLKSISHQKRLLDPESDELWGNVVLMFLKAVLRLDLSKRTHRLVQRLINDTAKHITREYGRQRRISETEVATEHDLLSNLAGRADYNGFDKVDNQDEREFILRQLQTHLNSGRITSNGYEIIIATRIEEIPLREYAKQSGISIRAAEKRRQRAESAINRFKNSQ